MTELQSVIDTLDNAADSFDGIATKEQKKIYDEVITLAKDLDLDAQGKVKQSIANLKRLTEIKARLAALSKDKEWVAGISGFAKYFGVLQQQQNAYFSDHFPSLTLSKTAKEKHEMMKQLAVQNTMEGLMGSGLKANVTDKLNDILLRAVTTNARFADLQEELRAHLLGKDGGQGAFARYATTYATTALSQFTGQNNKLLTDDLGCEWFMYTGSNKETSREFCIQLTAKRFIHRSEIPTILTGRIDDYQCAIYEKTGLPYGMIEGTTADNFQCNCGGWNCRHQLVPIADALVPASLRAKFAKGKQQVAENSTGYLSQKKGSEAFYTLMDKNGATKEYINDAINQMAWFGVKFEFGEEMTASQIKRTFEDACLKMQKNTDAYYKLSDNIKSLESTFRQLFPNKYGDILQESNIACNLATLKHNGYSKTKERLSKIYKRMDGIVNRYADIGSQKNQYNRRKIEQAAEKLGVKLEDSMSFTQANSGHVNPLDERMNCQRCAVTFEMRMRGLNVAAKWRPEKDDPFFDRKKYGEDAYLSANIWSNTRTGEAPIKHFVLKDTYEKSLSAFNTATQNSGRYILYVYWNAGWSHVVNFIRNKRGKGFFYDGQICTYNTFEYYYTECNKKVANALVVWRVDDCDLDKSLINKGTFLILK